jgi:hypothetical protein
MWKQKFSGRIAIGQTLQRFFGAEYLSNLFVTGFRLFPFMAKGVISKTHGKPF